MPLQCTNVNVKHALCRCNHQGRSRISCRRGTGPFIFINLCDKNVGFTITYIKSVSDPSIRRLLNKHKSVIPLTPCECLSALTFKAYRIGVATDHSLWTAAVHKKISHGSVMSPQVFSQNRTKGSVIIYWRH